MKFAQRVFLVAGIYGVLTLLPQYFLEGRIAMENPPMMHPEYFYGFIGVALAWQCAFLLVARDVQRYRPFMLAAVLEKLSFGLAVPVLYAQGRVAALVAGVGVIDLLLAVLFVADEMSQRRWYSVSVPTQVPMNTSRTRLRSHRRYGPQYLRIRYRSYRSG
jgi:hypothetical protein